METKKLPVNRLDNSLHSLTSPAKVRVVSFQRGDNTSSCHRDRIGMLKQTWAFYLLWLIQIFSAINTAGGWSEGAGCDDATTTFALVAPCDGAGACEQLRQCQRVTDEPLWAPWPIYEHGAPAAHTWFIDVPRQRTPHWMRDALSPPNKAHSHATERTRTRPSPTRI